MLENAFSNGRVIDFLLLVVLIELIVVSVYWVYTKNGIAPRLLMPTLGAGVCLMLALKAVIQGATIAIPALWLFFSLLFHLADLRLRWQRKAICQS